jgi:hypothetical protein
MKSLLMVAALLIVHNACGPQHVLAQQTAGGPDVKGRLALRVYQVVDLLVPTPNYPYRGSELPTTGVTPANRSVGRSALGGGGFGSASGQGGGFFRVPPEQNALSQTGEANTTGSFAGGDAVASNPRPGGGGVSFGIEDLVAAITGVVAPDTWAELGGPGTVRILGTMLLVSQTEEVHRSIEQLLSEIRAQGGTVRTVTVAARWLALDDSQSTQLLAASGGKSPAVLARAALEKLPADALRYQGQVTCHSGQTVHIVSGTRHTVMTGVIPVVGGSGPGYQPLVDFPNAGVLLQITPLLLPGGKTASLDLQSSVTTWQPPEPLAVTSGESSLSIDRIRLSANQLATTVRIPVGEPVLVGGLTTTDAESPKPLYLIVELTVDDPPAPAK